MKKALIMAVVLAGSVTLPAEARNCNILPKSCNLHHGAPNAKSRAQDAIDKRLEATATVQVQAKRKAGVKQIDFPNSGYMRNLRGKIPNVGQYVPPPRRIQKPTRKPAFNMGARIAHSEHESRPTRGDTLRTRGNSLNPDRVNPDFTKNPDALGKPYPWYYWPNDRLEKFHNSGDKKGEGQHYGPDDLPSFDYDLRPGASSRPQDRNQARQQPGGGTNVVNHLYNQTQLMHVRGLRGSCNSRRICPD